MDTVGLCVDFVPLSSPCYSVLEPTEFVACPGVNEMPVYISKSEEELIQVEESSVDSNVSLGLSTDEVRPLPRSSEIESEEEIIDVEEISLDLDVSASESKQPDIIESEEELVDVEELSSADLDRPTSTNEGLGPWRLGFVSGARHHPMPRIMNPVRPPKFKNSLQAPLVSNNLLQSSSFNDPVQLSSVNIVRPLTEKDMQPPPVNHKPALLFNNKQPTSFSFTPSSLSNTEQSFSSVHLPLSNGTLQWPSFSTPLQKTSSSDLMHLQWPSFNESLQWPSFKNPLLPLPSIRESREQELRNRSNNHTVVEHYSDNDNTQRQLQEMPFQQTVSTPARELNPSEEDEGSDVDDIAGDENELSAGEMDNTLSAQGTSDEMVNASLNDVSHFPPVKGGVINCRRTCSVKPFYCIKCPRTFVSRHAVVTHMRSHKIFACEKCDKVFTMKAHLVLHMEVHFDATPTPVKSKLYACKWCEKSFTHMDGRELHQQSHKDVATYDCYKCDSTFTVKSDLVLHRQVHSFASKVFTCEKCDKTFTGLVHFRAHMRRHRVVIIDESRPFPCKRCDRTFKTSNSRGLHMRGHKGIHKDTYYSKKTFVCKKCRKTFTIKASWTLHMKLHDQSDVVSNKSLSLTSIDVPCIQPAEHTVHMRADDDASSCSKSLACTKCDKTFRYPSDLELHNTRAHKDVDSINRPFTCAKCDGAFAYRAGLVLHMKCHEKVKNRPRLFACKKCDRTFTYRAGLTLHLRGHKDCNSSKKQLGLVGKKRDVPVTSNLKSELATHVLAYKGAKSNIVSKSYSCKKCCKTFTIKSDFVLHLQSHKGVYGRCKPFSCKKCDRSFTYPAGLALHMRVHKVVVKNSTTFACKTCSKTFTSKSDRLLHMQIHKDADNPSKTFACKKCDRTFTYLAGLVLHMRVHKDADSTSKSFACKKCSRTFTYAAGLALHMQVHKVVVKNSKTFACKMCSKTFTSKSDCLLHMQIHKDADSTIKLFACKKCDRTFTYLAGLVLHMRVHKDADSTSKTFSCKDCDKTFAYRAGLVLHRRVHKYAHITSKSFACKKCDRTFTYPAGLALHMRVHKVVVKNSKTFACKKCSKNFTSKSDRLLHMQVHKDAASTSKSFACKKCDRTFTYQAGLVLHMRVHKDAASTSKTFSCKICDKTFAYQADLALHRRVHKDAHITGKSFACTKCDRTFTYLAGLVLHMRGHNGTESTSKTFACKNCHKTFTVKSDLVLHMQDHKHNNPFSCNECDKSFRKKTGLSLHFTRVHKVCEGLNCQQCGKLCSTIRMLNRHALTHAVINENNVGDAGETFPTLYKHIPEESQESVESRESVSYLDYEEILDTHIVRPSSDAREYVSDVLHSSDSLSSDMQGNLQQNLKQQKRVHSKNSVMFCDVCGESFRHKTSLILHIVMKHLVDEAHNSEHNDIGLTIAGILINHAENTMKPSNDDKLVIMERACTEQVMKSSSDTGLLTPEIINIDHATKSQDTVLMITEVTNTEHMVKCSRKIETTEIDHIDQGTKLYTHTGHILEVTNTDKVIKCSNETGLLPTEINRIDHATKLSKDTALMITEVTHTDQTIECCYNTELLATEIDHIDTGCTKAELHHTEQMALHSHYTELVTMVINQNDQETKSCNETGLEKLVVNNTEQAIEQSSYVSRVAKRTTCVNSSKAARRNSVRKRTKYSKHPSTNQRNDTEQSDLRYSDTSPLLSVVMPGNSNDETCDRGVAQCTVQSSPTVDLDSETPKSIAFSCKICHKGYTNHVNFKTHMLSHSSDPKPFVCGVCNVRFNRAIWLKIHTFKHTGYDSRPFECNKCKNRFATKIYLKGHMKKIHNEYIVNNTEQATEQSSYVSKVAKRTICVNSSKAARRNSVRKRTKYSKHPSTNQRNDTEQSDLRYSDTSPLLSDVMPGNNNDETFARGVAQCTVQSSPTVNLGSEKLKSIAFSCKICHKGYTNHVNFKTHMLSHSSDPKPFVCSVCNVRFNRAIWLRIHMFKHTGYASRPFECNECKKRFASKTYLKSHMKKKHMNFYKINV